MSLRTPTQFLAALRAEGLKVVTLANWTDVDRPGPWDPHGIIDHHTGPYSTVDGMVRMLKNGRTGLPGPLCQLGIGPDGTCYAVGWHDANHAGAGDAAVLAAVLRDEPAPRPVRDSVDGNAAFYGIEAIHKGSGEWPEAQVEAMVRANAAICRLHGWTANSVIGHREWTTRKVDPGGAISMADVRRRTAARLQSSTTPTPTPPPLPPVSGDTVVYQRYTANDGRGEYVVTLEGAVHIKNPTHRKFLVDQGMVSKSVTVISPEALDALLEKE